MRIARDKAVEILSGKAEALEVQLKKAKAAGDRQYLADLMRAADALRRESEVYVQAVLKDDAEKAEKHVIKNKLHHARPYRRGDSSLAKQIKVLRDEIALLELCDDETISVRSRNLRELLV